MVIVLNIIIYLYYKKIIIEKWYFTFLTVILLTISLIFKFAKKYTDKLKTKEHDISHNIKQIINIFKNNKLLRAANVTDNEVVQIFIVKENLFLKNR